MLRKTAMDRFLWIGLSIALLPLLLACSAGSELEAPAQSPAAVPVSSAEPNISETNAAPPASLVEDLRSLLSVEMGISASELSLRSTEAVEWPDACLGVPRPDELCAQVITPGYRIVLSTLTQSYEFHTDRSGSRVRRVPDHQPHK